MLSKNFLEFLFKIKFSNSPNPNDDFEEIKAHDIASDDGVIINPGYAQVKIIFPLGTDDYGKKEFVDEGLLFLEENKLMASLKIFYTILLGFEFYKIHPSNAIKFNQVKFLNYINQLKKKCKLSQFYVLKNIRKISNELVSIKLDSFEMGRFDYKKMKNLIQMETESDYHIRFLKEFKVSESEADVFFAFSRENRDIFFIDFYLLFKNKYVDYDTFLGLNDLYFEATTIKTLEKFWGDFEQEQKVSVSYGAPFFDPLRFKFSQLDQGVQISIYHKLNGERRGWVVPFQNFLARIDFNFQYELDETNRLTSRLYLSLKSTSCFTGILNQLINFLSKGNFELGEQKFSEAILNYWVALDTILNNTEEGNSNLLKNRVSALLWYSERSTHKSVYFKISESYTKRSKYVHAGEPAEEADAVFLRRVCQTILGILINVHNESAKVKAYTYEEWIDAIDELADLGRNTADVPTDLLRKIGIIEE
jgi:hypothetical protein